MANISIYLNDTQQHNLEKLKQIKGGNISNSALIASLVEKELILQEKKLMIDDAIAIDKEELGWDATEELCQITDMEAFG